MAKYSEEFKLQLIEEYVEGTLCYKLLARKYEVQP
ncbi:transposase [Planococcus glaciei]|uniref:Transposase n=1 Tax=Planococcus glaciei TaxID=459472 RepID=A0A7H8QAG6_9BACL|nr:transposase [Planococcus glaciei]QKX51034.1 transposase [Planococcus glaciei]